MASIDLLYDVSGLLPTYGSFFSTQTQVNSVGVNTPMTLNNTALSNGVTLVSGTKLKVARKGVYNVQFSAQIKRVAGGTLENVYIWFRKNGVDIPASNTSISSQNNGNFYVAAWNIFVDMDVNDYVEIMWETSSVDLVLIYDTNGYPSQPVIPSLIVTVSRV